VSRAGRAWFLGAIATASWLLGGCDGTYDLPADVRWQSTHFDYLTRAGDSTICPDVVGQLEEHFALLQDHLGFEWPPGAKVTYEKMLDADDLQQHGNCPLDRGACALETLIKSSEGMHLHELVHAYLWPTGYPPTVLVEGAAVALSCGSSEFPVKPTYTWDELAGLGYVSATSTDVYDAGAWLVGYLLTQYDPRLFTTLYQRVPTGADSDRMDSVFREVYGESLATIWAAALEGTAPHDVCIWQCSRPPVSLDRTPLATNSVCGLPSFHSLPLPSDSLVSVGSTGAGVQIETCDQTALYPNWVAGATTLDLYELPAGAYFVGTDGGAGTMTFDGSLSSLVTPTCAEATNLAAFDGFDGFFLSGPNTSLQWFLPLPPPPASSKLGLGFAGGALLKVCASCDPASCVFPPGDGSWTWAPGQMASVAVDPFPPNSYFQASFNWAY
jgi:hypothetical protein